MPTWRACKPAEMASEGRALELAGRASELARSPAGGGGDGTDKEKKNKKNNEAFRVWGGHQPLRGCSPKIEEKTSRPEATNGQQFPCPAFKLSTIIDF